MSGLRDPAHVVILGAGAMGCVFGGTLREGGLGVTLVDTWAEHVEAIRRRGLRLVGHEGDRAIPIRATTDISSVAKADIVSVHCKATDTLAAARSAIPGFGKRTVAISFQNGIGNEEAIASVVGAERVLGGWTALGASVVSPGIVRNYSAQPTQVGEMAGGISARAREIAAAFSGAGLETDPSGDIVGGMWKKMMVNIGLSAPSAFTNLPLERAVAIPELRAVIDIALDEAAAVARASEIDLSAEDTRYLLDKLVGKGGTGSNMSSLCVDVLNRRPTEIDFINGVVVRLGERLGIPTPVNRTFVAAVKGLESHCIAGSAPR